MKKSIYFLTIMLIFAVILCACVKNAQDEEITTVQNENPTSDVGSPESDDTNVEVESNEETTLVESPSDTNTGAEETSTTEPETTKASIPPIVLDFNAADEKTIKNHFTDASQTDFAIETDDDGEVYVKLTTSGAYVSDPNITFNLQSFAKKIQATAPNGTIYKYMHI